MKLVKNNIQGKPLAWILTMIYFASYVTRINFSAVIQEIITDLGYEKSALSIILVVLSITYGAGQIVNGRIGDRIKPENLIFAGLIIATAMNLCFPFASGSIPMMTVLWAINGFAQAMMWPPIVKILVASCDDATYGYSVVRISWGSSFGTILVYLSAPLIIKIASWQTVFYASAAIGLLSALTWGLLKSRVGALPKKEEKAALKEKKQERLSLPRAAVLPLLLIALGIIFQGMLRDGVSSWMPTYLSEIFGLDSSASILLTVSLALFSIVTFAIAGWLYRRFFTNEVACGAVIFVTAALSALLLFGFFEVGGVILAVLMMTMITGCMHGVNLMLITHVPKRFKKYGNISTVSGAINSCTYIGAAISTYGVAVLAENIGWRWTVGVWAVIALLGTLCCLLAMKPWKQFFDKQ